MVVSGVGEETGRRGNGAVVVVVVMVVLTGGHREVTEKDFSFLLGILFFYFSLFVTRVFFLYFLFALR